MTHFQSPKWIFSKKNPTILHNVLYTCTHIQTIYILNRCSITVMLHFYNGNPDSYENTT